MPDLGTALKQAARGSEPALDIGALVKVAHQRTLRRRVAGVVVVLAALALALPLLRSSMTDSNVVGRNRQHDHVTLTPGPTVAPGSRRQPFGAPQGGAGSAPFGSGIAPAPVEGGTRTNEGLAGPTGHIAYSDQNGVELVDPATKRIRLVRVTDSMMEATTRDGSTIAYARYNMATMNIETMRVDGSDHRALVTNMVGSPYSLTWSPDGSRILFAADTSDYGSASFKLYIVNRDGSGLRAFDEIPTSDQPADPEWSPDGTKIAYTSEVNGASSTTGSASPIVKIYDVKTGARTTVVDGSAPSWSPDGRSLAYIDRSSGLDLIDLATHHHTVLDVGQNAPAAAAGSDADPSFSPDGAFIAYTRASGSSSNPTGATSIAIWYVRLNGTDKTLIGPNGQGCSWSR